MVASPRQGRETRPAIPFYPSPRDIVKLMLEVAEPREGQLLIDLGCGDGRIVEAAASDYRCRAVGVEVNPGLAAYASTRLMEKKLRGARVVRGDLFKFDVSGADILTLYLTTSALKLLRPRLEFSLKPGAKVVAHDFPVPGWRPALVETKVSAEDGKLHRVYLYEAGRSFPAMLKLRSLLPSSERIY